MKALSTLHPIIGRGHPGAAAVALSLAAACGGSSGGDPDPEPRTVGGLDARPSNTSCVAPDVAAAGAGIALEQVFDGLPFEQPLAMLQAPGESERWFVLEKTGRVRVFPNTPDVAGFDADFIDLDVNAQSEGGLLGMAFDPDFASNGEVYLSWTEGSPMTSIVARFRSIDGGRMLDDGSRQDVIRVSQDFANHNGGQLAFGPDGRLYVGFGDGGSAGDPNNRAQDTTNLLGAMLRLDVSGATPYSIPADNPFAGNPSCPAEHSAGHDCPEIYAWGLRNPWRWSFDRASGALWAGDVGQGAREEVDRIERGGNYGWDCREGTLPHGAAAPICSTVSGLIEPVHDYARDQGTSITGGYVYRGSTLPTLTGHYLFGDYGSGRIWWLVDDGAGGFDAEELLDTTLSIASFGEDIDGELYVVDILGGDLYRIVADSAGAPPEDVAMRLSATGCVDPDDPAEPAGGLVPYSVAAPFWSDGADKQRWLAIPNGTTISVDADDDFLFPPGTVLMKHFRLQQQLVETRLFMRHANGEWAGYSYEWNDDGGDALLVEGGKQAEILGQDWIFPSGGDCMRCHTAAAGFSLGLESAQLNDSHRYPATGRTANQLLTLDRTGMFARPLGDPSVQPSLADPAGPASVERRARAYLHTNCAQCHRPDGPAPTDLDLRWQTALASTGACEAAPQNGDLGIADARIIAAGDPDRSVLLARLARRDAHGMPPLASSLVDSDGAELVRQWIAGLGGCI